jgi:hypothetical protein
MRYEYRKEEKEKSAKEVKTSVPFVSILEARLECTKQWICIPQH